MGYAFEGRKIGVKVNEKGRREEENEREREKEGQRQRVEEARIWY